MKKFGCSDMKTCLLRWLLSKPLVTILSVCIGFSLRPHLEKVVLVRCREKQQLPSNGCRLAVTCRKIHSVTVVRGCVLPLGHPGALRLSVRSGAVASCLFGMFSRCSGLFKMSLALSVVTLKRLCFVFLSKGIGILQKVDTFTSPVPVPQNASQVCFISWRLREPPCL